MHGYYCFSSSHRTEVIEYSSWIPKGRYLNLTCFFAMVKSAPHMSQAAGRIRIPAQPETRDCRTVFPARGVDNASRPVGGPND